MRDDMRIILRFMIISFKKTYTYKFEMVMTIIHMLFALSFTIIFWYTLLSIVPDVGGWNFKELMVYTAVVFLGDGIGGVFFGFRDMPQLIINGELDKYLSRPVNAMICLLFENVSVIFYIEQLVVSIMLMVVALWGIKLNISLLNVFISFIMLVTGAVLINLLFGILSFLSFWFGHTENLYGLLESITDVKQYPVSVFPADIRTFLTCFIPVAFVSYYPAAVLLGKMNVGLNLMACLMVVSGVIVLLFLKLWKNGIKKYESNGG